MRRLMLFLFPLLLLAWWTQTFAQADDVPLPDPLILTDDESSYPLGLHMEILEDPSGELTIEDVVSPEFDSRFIPSQVEIPNYGFTDSAYWVRLHVRNESQLMNQWLLDIAYANMHYVDLYSPQVNGDGFDIVRSGALRSPASRAIRHPHTVFNLSIPSQSEQTVYLRFFNGASMTLPLWIWEPAAFLANTLQSQIWHGIFLGIIVGLLGYNLFLFFTLRDVIYFYLALLLSGILFYDISQTGVLEAYFIPGSYFLKQEIISLSVTLIFIPLILFNDSFVAAKKLLPRVHRLNLVIACLWAALGLMIFVISYHDVAMIMSSAIVVTLAIVAGVGALAWWKGFRATRFLLIAWAGILVGLLLFILTRMGFISSNLLTENSYRIAFVWMAVCWSIALADRINVLREETESSNRDLQNSENRLSQILEGLPIGVVVYGQDYKPSYANQRVNEILGNPDRNIEPDLTAGRTLQEALQYYSFQVAGSDQDYPLEKLPVYRALHGEPASVDDVVADLIDRRVPIEIWASPVRNDQGSVESAVVAFQDISERKQSEMALRDSEAHFRVIVENIFDGIAFLDHDRRVLYVSPSYKQLNGINAEELIGRSGVGTVHPDDRTYVAETFQKLLQQPGGRVSEEYRIAHRDGSWVWVETRAMNLLDDPHVRAVVLNSRNITERKQTEAELASYHRHLEHLVQERTEELEFINEQLSQEVAERVVLQGLLHKRIAWMSTLSLARQKIRRTADLPQTFGELSASIRQLLDAQVIFLIRWDRREGQIEFLCHSIADGHMPDEEAVKNSFQKDSAMRQEIEQGKMLLLPAEKVAEIAPTLHRCFDEEESGSLLLAPMSSGEAVTGVLGCILAKPAATFTPAQKELVTQITFDLVNLANEARYLEQARSLVAAEERNRLARDLHDSVTQVLFSASLVADVLPKIWRRDPDKAMESLDELRRLTRAALAEMRTLLLELRPTAVSKSPLHELLAQLTEAGTSRSDLSFRLLIEKTPRLPNEVHTAFYRIAQEALNNVVKHARASQVTLSLHAAQLTPEADGEQRVEVTLLVEDNGCGFYPEDEQMEHLGLGIMRERAANIQADLSIDSHNGKGTRVRLIWCDQVEDKL